MITTGQLRDAAQRFARLQQVARYVTGKTAQRNRHVNDWSAKREGLAVWLHDLRQLIEAWKSTPEIVDPAEPRMRYVDLTPRTRLQNGLEATAHCLYALADIAANFARKVTHGAFPSSFHSLAKKAQSCDGGLPDEAVAALGELKWYLMVRELRTEWSHHTSSFVGGNANDGPTFVARDRRRSSDRTFFPEDARFTAEEFISWVRAANYSLDCFAGYLSGVLLSEMDLDVTITRPNYRSTPHGLIPILLEDGRLDVQQISLREALQADGVLPQDELMADRKLDRGES